MDNTKRTSGLEETTETLEHHYSKRKELDLVRHTETIDRLVIQNKELQRKLDQAEEEIQELENKLTNNSIKISKNIFYVILGVIGFLGWYFNDKLDILIKDSIEMKHIFKEYKNKIEQIKLYEIIQQNQNKK